MNAPVDVRSSVVLADLNYLAPTRERPRTLAFTPAEGESLTTATRDSHLTPVHDIRGHEAAFSLDGQGFTVSQHASEVTDWTDEAQIRNVYYPEAERLLKEVTGADRVFIFDHTQRRRIPGLSDNRGGPRQPATTVHVDHTAKSGPQRVRDFLPHEADELLRGRVQVVNLWRPINHPVHDAPLAVAEAGSVAFDDLIPSDLVYRDRVGETYNVVFNPAHRWYYISEQRPDEVLFLKCYDSRTDVARFAPHTSLIVPNLPDGTPTRESIELRTFVFRKT